MTIVKTVESTKSGKGAEKSVKKEVPKAKDPLSAGFIDPLTSAIVDPLSVSDPLSAALFKPTQPAETDPSSSTHKEDQNVLEGDFEPWSARKTHILSKYTTSEKISITTSFLSSEDKEKLETKAQAAAADTFKHRLEQLDDLEEGSVRETLTLNQKDYVAKIDQLNKNLESAWEREQKVKALKIAIQCAKLLSDTSVIQFYPSKFVLITEILDNFGKLVYERIRQKSSFHSAQEKSVTLPANFTSDQVPDAAKETCRNWFFKIASIREMLPRFYAETAILKCYGFLTDKEYTQALIRLSNMTRGIGDPLVSAYARTYLCRVGMSVAPATRDHLMPCYRDTLFNLPQFTSEIIQDTLALQRLDMKGYTWLFEPAFQWIFQCLAHRCSEAVMEEVLKDLKERPNNLPCRGLILYSVLSSFRPEYIVSRSLAFAELIRDLDTPYPRHELYTSLGSIVVFADPPQDARLPLLREVWKAVTKFSEPKEYIACAEIWIEYVSKHLTKREVNNFLGDVIKHMTVERAFEQHYPQLLSMVTKILAHMHNFGDLFAMEKFLPFIDLLQKEGVKVEACKSIAQSFALHQKDTTNDPVILNAMMFVGKVMHDSLSALSLDDECRHISHLINAFITKVSFGKDFEQQLAFYVDARANFTNLDRVMVHLVQCVNQLAMRTWGIVKGAHTGKTASFVRACMAYAFITIPSLSNVFAKMQLYLISGRVSIANGALSQGDTFLKTAITLIPEITELVEIDNKRQTSEPLLSVFVRNFLATLLVVPDNPDLGVVYLFGGLLNALKKYHWQPASLAKVEVFTDAVCYLTASCQEEYIYSVHNVDSNDMLYGGDPKYVTELADLVDSVLDELLGAVNAYSDPNLRGRAAGMVFNKLILCSDFSDDKLVHLMQTMLSKVASQDDVMEICRRNVTSHNLKQRLLGREIVSA